MTTPLTDAELAAIEARANACFRAPWTATTFTVECETETWNGVDSEPDDCERCGGEGQRDVERIESPEEYPDGQVIADVPGLDRFAKPHAAFIAHARSDVPALIAEVRRLRAEVAKQTERADAEQARRISSDLLLKRARADATEARAREVHAVFTDAVTGADVTERERQQSRRDCSAALGAIAQGCLQPERCKCCEMRWLRYNAESEPPREVHIADVTVSTEGLPPVTPQTGVERAPVPKCDCDQSFEVHPPGWHAETCASWGTGKRGVR